MTFLASHSMRHLSRLELDRCSILPPLPRCFATGTLEPYHASEVASALTDSPQRPPSVTPCPPPESRLQFLPVPSRSTSDDTERQHHRAEKPSDAILLGTASRKLSCSCYGAFRSSYPVLPPDAATSALRDLYPHISDVARWVDISTCSKADKMNHVPTAASSHQSVAVQPYPSLRLGVLVGGNHSSAGLQNVLVGLWHFLRRFCQRPSELIGFRHGAIGLLKNDTVLLSDAGTLPLSVFCNRGGCDLLSCRPLEQLLKQSSQAQRAVSAMKLHDLDGLVLCIGKEDMLAAAQLAELSAAQKCRTRLVVVPHGNRGDFFLSDFLPSTLGFDTARRVVTELAGNIATDSVSSRKYYHFIRTGSSLLTLEASLATRPTLAILSEEVYQRKLRLCDIVKETADVICMRAAVLGKQSGCILLSDGVVENLPETDAMLRELGEEFFSLQSNAVERQGHARPLETSTEDSTLLPAAPEEAAEKLELFNVDAIPTRITLYADATVANTTNPQPPSSLSAASKRLFLQLPKSVRHFLLAHCHGKSKPRMPPVFPEILLAHLVEHELRHRPTFTSLVPNATFQYRTHDLEHECYSAIPTDFDCALGYSLGHTAGALIAGGYHGVVACLRDLHASVEDWVPCGVSILKFLSVTIDATTGKTVPCVPSRTLDMESWVYKSFQRLGRSWRIHCLHRSPGPIQFIPKTIHVDPKDLPLTLRAHYLSPQEFEQLVQTDREAAALASSETAALSPTSAAAGAPTPQQHGHHHHRGSLSGAAGAAARPLGTTQWHTPIVKTIDQLTELQLKRLNYKPRLPRVFFSPFTLESSDVTARLATRPALLRATFPITHNFRALEIVPVGLRLPEEWHLGTDRLVDDTETHQPVTPDLSFDKDARTTNCVAKEPVMPRSRSSVSLCGFVGTTSVVRVPVEDLVTTVGKPLGTSGGAASQAVSRHSKTARPSPVLKHGQCPLQQNTPVVKLSGVPRSVSQSAGEEYLRRSRLERTDGNEPDDIVRPQATPAVSLYPKEPSAAQPRLPRQEASRTASEAITAPTSCSSESPRCSSTVPAVGPGGLPHILDRLCTQHKTPVTPDITTASVAWSQTSGHRSGLAIAICFLGRPAPGAMNIVWGLQSYTKRLGGVLYGALGGLNGMVQGRLLEITEERLALYHNQGGIELLSRSSEHCRSEEDLEAFLTTCIAFKIRGLVLVGGTATISTAALLAEHFLQQRSKTVVIAVPMAIDAGIPGTEVTLGHDTTVRVFSSVIGSIMTEARTAKQWYFLRVSGRNLSHLCAECALETCPTLVLICEEVEKKKMTLIEITNFIADVVEARAERGMVYGVVLLSDSLLDHVPEVRMLFNEIDTVFEATADTFTGNRDGVIPSHLSTHSLSDLATSGRHIPQTEDGLLLLRSCLTPWGAALFSSLPPNIQWQFAFSKDVTQRVDLANVDTEVLLKTMVENELTRRKSLGAFRQPNAAFNCKTHCLAYQGRSALPTNFDCDYGFSLGYLSAVLIDGGQTGYLASLSNLHLPVQDWCPEALPLSSLINVKPVRQTHSTSRLGLSQTDLKLSLTVPSVRCSLDGVIYSQIQKQRLSWIMSDCFSNPGPVQFVEDGKDGSEDATDVAVRRLHVLKNIQAGYPLNPMTQLKEISRLCSEIKLICGQRAFSSSQVAAATAMSLASLLKGLRAIVHPLSSDVISNGAGATGAENDPQHFQSPQLRPEDLSARPFLGMYLAKSFFPGVDEHDCPSFPPPTVYPAARAAAYLVASATKQHDIC